VAQSFIQLPGGTQTGPKQVTEDIGTPGHVLQVASYQPATFYALFDRIALAANKYMAVLFNANSARKVCVQRIWAFQHTETAVTGIVHAQELRRITARTVGTAITSSIFGADTADTLSASITASHNDSAVTDSSLIRRLYLGSEEAKLTAAQALNSDTQAVFDWFGIDGHLVWTPMQGVKPHTLRNGQGIAIKNVSGAVGSASYLIEFTDEPV
jgi:hypothetical protein